MSSITLSASVRQNLLSLQSTAQMMSLTQNRLATGKKVNSALDNPANFFTSQSLNHRASDLNSLLDSIGQAQQTLKQADTGITSLSKLVESAKSLAKQAQQSTPPESTGALTVTGTAAIADDVAAELTGSATDGTDTLDTLGYADGDEITISDGTNSYTYTIGDATTEDVADLVAGINGSALNITADVASGDLVLAADSGAETITVTDGANLGFGTGNTTASATNATLGAMTGSLTFQVGSGAVQTITFGTGADQVSTKAELAAALDAITGIDVSINADDQIEIASTSKKDVTIGGTVAGNFFDTANVGANSPTLTVTTNSETRTTYQNQYNDLLTQIDSLAKDASYNGINLLAGDDLKVVFNEDGSSSLTIEGVSFTAEDLGLTALNGTEFQSNTDIDAVLANIDAALGTLRSQAAKFGSQLTTVQTRQDFTKNMINNLQVGADALVLADTNEEGANLLALQTRQQLSTTALSLSAQADQAVLRLF